MGSALKNKRGVHNVNFFRNGVNFFSYRGNLLS